MEPLVKLQGAPVGPEEIQPRPEPQLEPQGSRAKKAADAEASVLPDETLGSWKWSHQVIAVE
jgi:hypothetical protein